MGDKWKTNGLKNHQEVFEEKRMEVIIPKFQFDTTKIKVYSEFFHQYVVRDKSSYSFLDFRISKFNEYIELGCFLGGRPEKFEFSNGQNVLEVALNAKTNWGSELSGKMYDNVLIRYDSAKDGPTNDISICNRDIFYQTYEVDKDCDLAHPTAHKIGSVFAFQPSEMFRYVERERETKDDKGNVIKVIDKIPVLHEKEIEALIAVLGEEVVITEPTPKGMIASIRTLETTGLTAPEYIKAGSTVTVGLKGEAWVQKTSRFESKYEPIDFFNYEVVEVDLTDKCDEVTAEFEKRFEQENGYSLDELFEARGNTEKAKEIQAEKNDDFIDDVE